MPTRKRDGKKINDYNWHSRKRGNCYSKPSTEKQGKKRGEFMVRNTAENALEENMIKNIVCSMAVSCTMEIISR